MKTVQHNITSLHIFNVLKFVSLVYVYIVIAKLHFSLVGVPCTDVTVEGNDTVTCITGGQPPRSTYYPGTSYIWNCMYCTYTGL